MNTETPEINVPTSIGLFDNDGHEMTVIVVAREEWELHKARVESLVNLINGVLKGMAENPIFQSMAPPDVLEQMRHQQV